MRKFKIGEKLKLITSTGMAAKFGATAEVTGWEKNDYGREYISVRWLDKLADGQMDGGYDEKDFVSIDPEWD